MKVSGNVDTIQCENLNVLIAELSTECILRIRRGSRCWQGSNREYITPIIGASNSRAFRTASITKTFTAALVLLLSEEGTLSLEDCLPAHLPREICDRIHIFEGISYGPQITIAQLLCHRSGVFDYATDPRFFEHVVSAPSRQWSPLELLDEAINGRTPYFRPGEGLAYSDTGYVLLAMIIESVTGTSLAWAYRKRLLEPLALEHTYLEGQEPPMSWPVSHACAGSLDTFAFDPSFDTCGGGGLVSTAADLDRFITRLLGGSVFRKAETLRTMLEGTESPPGSGTRKIKTAAGLSAFSIADHLFWGHLGHWNSFMLHSAEEDISICGTFNQADEDPRHKRVLETAAIEAFSWE